MRQSVRPAHQGTTVLRQDSLTSLALVGLVREHVSLEKGTLVVSKKWILPNFWPTGSLLFNVRNYHSVLRYLHKTSLGNGVLKSVFRLKARLWSSSLSLICIMYNLKIVVIIDSICVSGYFCSGSSPEPAPVGQIYGDVCDPGSYCPNGTDISKPCPPGTFQPSSGLQAIQDCISCTAGMQWLPMYFWYFQSRNYRIMISLK